MRTYFSLKFFLSLSALFSDQAYAASDYYALCYFNDSNETESTKNISLMQPGFILSEPGQNFYWALNENSQSAAYTKLTGHIEDGFFIEEKLTYDDLISSCNNAIAQGTFFVPSKPSFKLFDFKAAQNTLTAYKYPIQFKNSSSNQDEINKMVIFGDSLSDTGNLKAYSKVYPSYPYWFGRFSDGFIWNDFLSKFLHLPVLNFSYGGAKTEGINALYFGDLVGNIGAAAQALLTGSSKDHIKDYLNNYLTTDSYSTKNSKITDARHTLFAIWMGSNDYIESLKYPEMTQHYFDKPDEPGGINTVLKYTVKNIIDQINMLHAKGAYHFLIFNLPDLGKTPLVTKTSYHKYADDTANVDYVSRMMTKAIMAHNNALREALKNLQGSLGNKINIITVDIGKSFDGYLQNQNILNSTYFNFNYSTNFTKYYLPDSNTEYIQDVCYVNGFYNSFFVYGDKEKYNFMYNNTCKDAQGNLQKRPLFWDQVHPSSYTHCFIAYYVQNILLKNGLTSKDLQEPYAYKNYCTSVTNSKELF